MRELAGGQVGGVPVEEVPYVAVLTVELVTDLDARHTVALDVDHVPRIFVWQNIVQSGKKRDWG